MVSTLMTFRNLLLRNLSRSSAVKLLGEMQTDATLLANNSLHCWMLHVACCCAKLKPVKLLAQCKRTQYCCVLLQVALKSTP